MSNQKPKKPDAFQAVMDAARTQLGRPDLQHQCRGRALSDEEHALADALMEIYAAGASGPDAIAAALSAKGVVTPSSGSADWTAESVASELAALNADLDEAYRENGFGG